MVKHIVFFKFKFNTEAVRQTLREKLSALPAQIPEIKEYELGDNIVEGDGAYDMVLVSAFESLETMDVYKAHPEHQQVLAYIKDVTSDIARIDYNF